MIKRKSFHNLKKKQTNSKKIEFYECCLKMDIGYFARMSTGYLRYCYNSIQDKQVQISML